MTDPYRSESEPPRLMRRLAWRYVGGAYVAEIRSSQTGNAGCLVRANMSEGGAMAWIPYVTLDDIAPEVAV